VHHIRLLLIGDEIARCVFGQTGIDLGQDLSVLIPGEKLLAAPRSCGRVRALLMEHI